ncbi:hypothetical protein DBR47_16190 [Paucibacter sp. KBW04]|uniref:hypothetical protein n=1 Tax=Paucibacter sp. KBW04 TaxID=2153361 RepID=UPI000F58C6D0|nr:hypothetical protein [Paucibacter sp. KBW04]RQO57359.1 hypothetical protein DBR47_16190 [Paucibacter sp. KBW04]
MHLMIPHASALGEACKHSLGTLALPHLSALMGLLKAEGQALGSDEYSLNTPFELALARERGLADTSAPVPTAAWLAAEAGLPSGAGQAWALLSPMHLAVGSDQVTAYAPELLELSEEESRAFFAALAELWPSDEGWQAHWLSPLQWLISHPSLAGLPSASLDRVVQRNVATWMPEARRLRTLQNEAQMLLHRQPLNTAREARKALPLNSLWISGCGAESPGAKPLPADLRLDSSLRQPLLMEDWAAWAEAWARLDDGAVSHLLNEARLGKSVQLTLCGERLARKFILPARSPLQKTLHRWLPPRAEVHSLLEGL